MTRSEPPRVATSVRVVALSVGAALAVACAADPIEPGAGDAGGAGPRDAGRADAGRAADAGGAVDAARVDAGRRDAGRTDPECVAKGSACGADRGITDPCCDDLPCTNGTCGGCGGDGLICRTGSTAVRDCCEGLSCAEDLPGGDVQCCPSDDC